MLNAFPSRVYPTLVNDSYDRRTARDSIYGTASQNIGFARAIHESIYTADGRTMAEAVDMCTAVVEAQTRPI